jgi:hypothetical protein
MSAAESVEVALGVVALEPASRSFPGGELAVSSEEIVPGLVGVVDGLRLSVAEGLRRSVEAVLCVGPLTVGVALDASVVVSPDPHPPRHAATMIAAVTADQAGTVW